MGNLGEQDKTLLCPEGSWTGQLQRVSNGAGRSLVLHILDKKTNQVFAIPVYDSQLAEDYRYAEIGAPLNVVTRNIKKKSGQRVQLESIKPFERESPEQQCYRLSDELLALPSSDTVSGAAARISELINVAQEFPPALLWVSVCAELCAPHLQHINACVTGLSTLFTNKNYIQSAADQGDENFSNLLKKCRKLWTTLIDSAIESKCRTSADFLIGRCHEIIALVPVDSELRSLAEQALPKLYDAFGLRDQSEEKRNKFDIIKVMQAMVTRRLAHEGFKPSRDGVADHQMLGRFFLTAMREI